MLSGKGVLPYMDYNYRMCHCSSNYSTGTEIGGKLINLPASVEDFILHWRNQELTIKKFKSANLNLLTSQFNSKESFDLGSLFLESRDLKTRRAFGSFVSYKLAKVS